MLVRWGRLEVSASCVIWCDDVMWCGDRMEMEMEMRVPSYVR